MANQRVIYMGSKLVHVFDLIDLDTGRKVSDSFVAEDAARDGGQMEYLALQQRWLNTWEQLKANHEGSAPEAPPPTEQLVETPEPPAPQGDPPKGERPPKK